jgi:sugar phosphate isomerase/epimerase
MPPTAEAPATATVLCCVSLLPIDFPSLIRAGLAGGFDAISVTPTILRRSQEQLGLRLADLRTMLDDSGLFLSEIEAAGNWLAPNESGYRWRQKTSDEKFVELGYALGARTLVAVYFGPPRPLEETAEGFARLCDMAAAAGMNVALEFPAFATICDVHTAWQVARLAGRPNAGVLIDTWHHYRKAADDEALRRVPGDRVLAVQLADADAVVKGPLEEDVAHRKLPGEGDLGIPGFLQHLREMDVRCPIGVEVWNKSLNDQGPEAAGRRLGEALRAALGQA